jgi:hypothetical protein
MYHLNGMSGEKMKVKILCLSICFLFTGCSYGMDMLERSMTNRADFSINVSYNSGTKILEISWSESPSTESFAGYEVYMIMEPWNEYGTYEVIAARYDLYPPSSSHFFIQKSELENLTTKNVQINVSTLINPGFRYEYYVRLGIIKKRKDENDDYYPINNQSDYINHTSLDKISGYKAVSIY